MNQAGHRAVTVSGENSQYDVVADGTLLFSKEREGRFPEEHEVRELLRSSSG